MFHYNNKHNFNSNNNFISLIILYPKLYFTNNFKIFIIIVFLVKTQLKLNWQLNFSINIKIMNNSK